MIKNFMIPTPGVAMLGKHVTPQIQQDSLILVCINMNSVVKHVNVMLGTWKSICIIRVFVLTQFVITRFHREYFIEKKNEETLQPPKNLVILFFFLPSCFLFHEKKNL